MAPEPDPPSPPASPAGSSRARAEQDGSPETFGPVTIRRCVKDDGRALILYTRRPDDETTAERST